MPIPPILPMFNLTPPSPSRGKGPASIEPKKERKPLLTLTPETNRFLLSALATTLVLLAVYGMCLAVGMKIGLVVLAVFVALVTAGIHAAADRHLLYESAGAATVAIELAMMLAIQLFVIQGLGYLRGSVFQTLFFGLNAALLYVTMAWIANRIGKQVIFTMIPGFIAGLGMIGVSILARYF